MKRQSSNSVKMLKIEARAIKQTRKLSASERSSVASIRLGKPKVVSPLSEYLRVPGCDPSAVSVFRFQPGKENGKRMRLSSSNSKPRPVIKTVASHGPT